MTITCKYPDLNDPPNVTDSWTHIQGIPIIDLTLKHLNQSYLDKRKLGQVASDENHLSSTGKIDKYLTKYIEKRTDHTIGVGSHTDLKNMLSDSSYLTKNSYNSLQSKQLKEFSYLLPTFVKISSICLIDLENIHLFKKNSPLVKVMSNHQIHEQTRQEYVTEVSSSR